VVLLIWWGFGILGGMSSEVVELCRALVAIPSVNPQDRAVEGEPYGEERMGAYVYDWLGRYGLEPQRQEAGEGRENVVAWAAGADRSKALLLSAHMDTVDVKGMTVEPFGAEMREGKIYGRGSCDDKGSLAALMIAFRDRVHKGGLPCDLVLLASCDEEYGMSGTRRFAEEMGAKVTAAIFAEPTELQVVVAHKGVVRLRLRSSGRSAHSATPELGENAIYRLARAAGAVEEIARGLAQRTRHPRLGHETLALTMVSGGQQINVIPDACQGSIDWRILPGRNAQDCRAELAAALGQVLTEAPEVETINDCAAMETDAAGPVVQAMLRVLTQMGRCRETEVVSYATDASAFSGLGIATPIWGPGSAKAAHTQDEHIEIAELEAGLAAYNKYLREEWGL